MSLLFWFLLRDQLHCTAARLVIELALAAYIRLSAPRTSQASLSIDRRFFLTCSLMSAPLRRQQTRQRPGAKPMRSRQQHHLPEGDAKQITDLQAGNRRLPAVKAEAQPALAPERPATRANTSVSKIDRNQDSEL